MFPTTYTKQVISSASKITEKSIPNYDPSSMQGIPVRFSLFLLIIYLMKELNDEISVIGYPTGGDK